MHQHVLGPVVHGMMATVRDSSRRLTLTYTYLKDNETIPVISAMSTQLPDSFTDITYVT